MAVSGDFRPTEPAAQGISGRSSCAASMQHPDGRWNLGKLADKALADNHLPIDHPADVKAQVAAIAGAATAAQGTGEVADLRSLPWSAIDDASTRDVDQIATSERLSDGSVRLRVAVTDTDALVPKGSPLDEFMQEVTASIYTPDKIYNMLPERLSTDLVSLNQGQDRLATVFEFIVLPDGSTSDERVFQAMVNNHAQLDYPSVGDWLEGKTAEPPAKLKADPVMAEQVLMQNEAAQRLQSYRQKHGALEFSDSEVRIGCENGEAKDITQAKSQLSNSLVENQMVTANQVQSRFLRAQNRPDRPRHPQGYATIQRAVGRPAPEKWARIVTVAQEHGYQLPMDVQSEEAGKALGDMLRSEKHKNPDSFGELSTAVIKLIGRGVFVAVAPGQGTPGHFGMGISDYVQSTASMRRLGDVVNARIMKAALEDKDSPYSLGELQQIAETLDARGQDAKKAERQAGKCAIATLLEKHIHEEFDGVITGVKGKNVWVKIGKPPVEGKLEGGNGLDVGDKVKGVVLESVNVLEGRIDFRRN